MRQTFLTTLLIVLIVATGIVWYGYIHQPSDTTVSTGFSATGSSAAERQLAQYTELKNLKPDLSVLSDPLFQSLVRYRPQGQGAHPSPGRPNPFVPF